MQDPDLKCRHFGMLWHFLAFYGILAFLPKSLIRNQVRFFRFYPTFRLFPTFRLSDSTALPKLSKEIYVYFTNQQHPKLEYSIFTSFHEIQNCLCVSWAPLRSIIMRCHFDHKAARGGNSPQNQRSFSQTLPTRRFSFFTNQAILGIPHTFTNQRDPLAVAEINNSTKTTDEQAHYRTLWNAS